MENQHDETEINGEGETKVLPIWRHVARQVVIEFKYGDTIPMEWLAKNLELYEPEEGETLTRKQFIDIQFDNLNKIEGLRNELLIKHQRYITNVRGVGYQIVSPPHQTDAAMKKLGRELRKHTSDALRAMVNINHTALSLDDARRHADAMGRLGWLRTVGMRYIEDESAEKPKQHIEKK